MSMICPCCGSKIEFSKRIYDIISSAVYNHLSQKNRFRAFRVRRSVVVSSPSIEIATRMVTIYFSKKMTAVEYPELSSLLNVSCNTLYRNMSDVEYMAHRSERVRGLLGEVEGEILRKTTTNKINLELS
jgi:hypothetical protein